MTCNCLSHYDLGFMVDDLEPVYRAAERRDAFDREALRQSPDELPGDVVQLILRDLWGPCRSRPARAVRLPDGIRVQLKGIWKINPQSEDSCGGCSCRTRRERGRDDVVPW